MEGGDDLAVFIDVGIAANFGDGHFNFVLVIPDEKTWAPGTKLRTRAA